VDTLTLDDWPPGHPSRSHRVHAAYLRAARRAAARKVAYIRAADIASRDKWACTACGQPVPQAWTATQLATAPALTFAVPWEDGGSYTRANARLVHYGCAQFSDSMLRRQLAAILTSDIGAPLRAGKDDETCTQGHPLAGANLLSSSDGRRRCRQCRNDRESGRRQPWAALPA
jgi:hypothetical protein